MKGPSAGNRVCAPLLALVLGVGGCVVGPAGYQADGEVDYSGGFYQPYGIDYGGWGPGYYPGPPRGGWRGRGGGGRPFRSGPAGREAPSIPHGSRGGAHGGGHPGGGHPGGGHH